MRKTYAGCIAAVLCLAGAVQADNGWGPVVAYWDAGDWGDGAGVGVKFSFEIIPQATFDIRGTWFNDLSGEVDGLESSVEVIPIEGGVSVVRPAGAVELFGGGGIGYYQINPDLYLPDGVKVSPDVDDEIGFYINAGVEIPLVEDASYIKAARITFFLEALYRSISLKDITVEGGTYRISENMSGFNGQAGLMMRW
jgi:hypothetical protein